MANTCGLTLFNITKKFKNSNNGNDRLGKLPENVLVQILSLLPTKDAVRTSVLSTEWKHLWTLVTNLSFDDMMICYEKRKKIGNALFMNFVERVLLLHDNSTVESFYLSFCEDYDEARVYCWIFSAIRRNAKRLRIDCRTIMSRFVFPRIYESQCLTVLELWMDCILRVPSYTYFSGLKILDLRRVTIQDESFSLSNQLDLNFPVLEAFKLDNCEWLDVDIVNIYAPALEIFTVYRYMSQWGPDFTQGGLVTIFGPSMTKFKLAHHSFNMEFILDSPSSVVDASVEFSTVSRNWDPIQFGLRTLSLLSQFSNVKSLTLSDATVEAFAHIDDLQDRSPTFDNLINLTISGEDYVIDVALVTLLRSSPALESLIFARGISCLNKEEVLQGTVPHCLISQLKVVEFQRFSGEEDEVEAATYFLKNAQVLEKMKMTAWGNLLHLEKTKNEILTVLRGSRTCVTILVS